MSFAEVMAELSALTVEQRQFLIRRALELEDLPLSEKSDESWWNPGSRHIAGIPVHQCL